ncbi:EAL domain-containing protein [Roseomonas sp. CECT 9278]|uniref:EAL domain-containing protein n=1 Tax=Roseomonas sp. CECT 9278 TaxID=2845823 RepID=UPI001E35FF03|nr:EAL domain-containing protein [Roseomonas sp. CECT 9278]CAH0250235.1 putative signaling protein [Roseomonas sp. CECT 9278]
MDGILPQAASQRVAAEDLGARLADALAAGGAGLRLDLQPICAAATLDPVGYEALLRWDHPEFGPIPPRETLAAAEAVGRGVALDAWVLVHGFRLRAGWPRGGPYLALNVSMAGVLTGHAAPMVRAAIEATGVDPRGLSLELPEAAVTQDLAGACRLAAALRGLGLSLAIDDFGGAHGSARVLRDIPFAAVKLDPALTAGLDGTDPGAERSRALVGAVVDMAHALGAITVAEAVETADQMRALRDARVDALQGWLLGRPGAFRP